MASVAEVKEAIILCSKSQITLNIWGKHGIGKSAIVKEVAESNKKGIINFRLSQIESSDLRGLLDKKAGKTVYLPPAQLPVGDLAWDEVQKIMEETPEYMKESKRVELQPRLNEGILFLDESFRAQDDVQQCLFELVLDRKLGQWVLPKGWSIVCANNFFEGYLTNAFNDPAFLDRFCHITLSSGDRTMPEWIDYMTQHHNNATEIIDFCSMNYENLDGTESCDLGFKISPSRRSWDMVSRVLKYSKDFSDKVVNEVIAGLVGRDLALSFSKHKCPIKPIDIIENGVKALESKLNKLVRNQLVGLTWGLRSMLKDKMADNKFINIALDYSEWVIMNTKENDLVTGFLSSLVIDSSTDGAALVKKAALTNPQIASLISAAEKKLGKRGSLIQELHKRESLAILVSDTAWGI